MQITSAFIEISINFFEIILSKSDNPYIPKRIGNTNDPSPNPSNIKKFDIINPIFLP